MLNCKIFCCSDFNFCILQKNQSELGTGFRQGDNIESADCANIHLYCKNIHCMRLITPSVDSRMRGF